MHPGNQQPLAITRSEQLHRVRDARRAAGQHHDAVGPARGPGFKFAQMRRKSDKSDRGGDEDCRQYGEGRRPQAAARRTRARTRRYIVGRRSHAKSEKSSAPADLRRFSDEVESALPGVFKSIRQSMSSSVANSVRRDAQAVIAAMPTAWT